MKIYAIGPTILLISIVIAPSGVAGGLPVQLDVGVQLELDLPGPEDIYNCINDYIMAENDTVEFLKPDYYVGAMEEDRVVQVGIGFWGLGDEEDRRKVYYYGLRIAC